MYCALWIQLEITVPPKNLTPPIIAIGLSIGLSHREHVKGVAAEPSSPEGPTAIGAWHRSNDVTAARKLSWKSSAPEDPTPHRSNASEDPMASTLAVRPPMAAIQAQCDRKVRRPHRKIQWLRRKRDNGYKRLVRFGGLFNHLTLSILELLEFREVPHTSKNTSKPTQVLSDQILRFSTSFVSVSTRLALE